MKRNRLRLWVTIGVVAVIVLLLLISGVTAYAVTSVDGYNDTLQGIIQLVGEQTSKGIEGILELFGMILP